MKEFNMRLFFAPSTQEPIEIFCHACCEYRDGLEGLLYDRARLFEAEKCGECGSIQKTSGDIIEKVLRDVFSDFAERLSNVDV